MAYICQFFFHLKCIPIFLVLCLPALVDWGLQKINIRESNNVFRFISGFLLGVSILFIELNL